MTPEQRSIWVRSMGARQDWWALQSEPIVEPEWEIIDAHCHFWIEKDIPDPVDTKTTLRTSRYMPDNFLRDVGGHKLTAFVYIECGSSYYTDGPAHLRPIGEIEFAMELSQQLNGGKNIPKLGAISAFADLTSPELCTLLNAYVEKGGNMVKSIRHSGARLEDPSARLLAGAAPSDLYLDPAFRRGVASLGERGLHFEAFQFHFQLPQLAELIKSAPETTFIVNHLGAPVGYGHGPDADAHVLAEWAAGVETVAKFPNVVMKLGGMASPVTEYDAALRDIPPSASDFVAERGAFFHHAIGAFGPERCLFESNFPVDSVSISYANLWNAYKMMASEYRDTARQALLSETARKIYDIELQPLSEVEPNDK